jgi:hypothetical protein
MWKCLSCGTENEWNFCTNCRSAKEASEEKQTAVEDKIESPIIHSDKSEEVVSQLVAPEQNLGQDIQPEQSIKKQEEPETTVVQSSINQQEEPDTTVTQNNMNQQDIPDENAVNSEGSSKKGCVIAIIVVIAIVGLLSAAIFAAFNMIFGSNDATEEAETEVYIIEDYVMEVEEDTPFDFSVWPEVLRNPSDYIVQIENEGVTLDIPLPPGITRSDMTVEDDHIFLSEGEGEEWLSVRVMLRGSITGDFESYSDYEMERLIEWHEGFAEVNNVDYYVDRDTTLLIIDWEDEIGEGVTFTKISIYNNQLLIVEISFEYLEGREDFFQVYGFNNSFQSIIRDIVAERTMPIELDLDEVDLDEEELEDDERAEWTQEERELWSELSEEYFDIYDRSFDMYFYIWDYVILDDVILDRYPNADVDRLVELHEGFGDRFDELNEFFNMDRSRAFNGEYNQNILRDMEEAKELHNWFYYNFRAALEGRPPVN